MYYGINWQFQGVLLFINYAYDLILSKFEICYKFSHCKPEIFILRKLTKIKILWVPRLMIYGLGILLLKNTESIRLRIFVLFSINYCISYFKFLFVIHKFVSISSCVFLIYIVYSNCWIIYKLIISNSNKHRYW